MTIHFLEELDEADGAWTACVLNTVMDAGLVVGRNVVDDASRIDCPFCLEAMAQAAIKALSPLPTPTLAYAYCPRCKRGAGPMALVTGVDCLNCGLVMP